MLDVERQHAGGHAALPRPGRHLIGDVVNAAAVCFDGKLMSKLAHAQGFGQGDRKLYPRLEAMRSGNIGLMQLAGERLEFSSFGPINKHFIADRQFRIEPVSPRAYLSFAIYINGFFQLRYALIAKARLLRQNIRLQ